MVCVSRAYLLLLDVAAEALPLLREEVLDAEAVHVDPAEARLFGLHLQHVRLDLVAQHLVEDVDLDPVVVGRVGPQLAHGDVVDAVEEDDEAEPRQEARLLLQVVLVRGAENARVGLRRVSLGAVQLRVEAAGAVSVLRLLQRGALQVRHVLLLQRGDADDLAVAVFDDRDADVLAELLEALVERDHLFVELVAGSGRAHQTLQTLCTSYRFEVSRNCRSLRSSQSKR